MIDVEYLSEEAYGEPGPNIVWRGAPEDFRQLFGVLHELGMHNGVCLDLTDLNYIQSNRFSSISVKSSEGGKILLKTLDEAIQIDLDCTLWQSILDILLTISAYPSYNYVDLDDAPVEEDANFIVSSEGRRT